MGDAKKDMIAEDGATTLVVEKKNHINATEVASPKGYKQTKVGVIPEEWEVIRLGDIGFLIGGGTPSTAKEEYWSGNIPWISSSDLIEESIYEINKHRFITELAISKSATQKIPKDSILIVSRVGVGKVAISDETLCTSQDFQSLISKDNNSNFLAYLIKEKTKLLIAFNQGTSIKGFVKNDLKNLKIPLPPLKEQQKIADILSTWDRAIEKMQTLITTKEKLKKGLMQKLLSGEVRFGAATSVAENKNSINATKVASPRTGASTLVVENESSVNATEVASPEWEEVRLGDLGKTYGGLTKKKAEDFGQGNAKYITYKNIYDNSKINIDIFDRVIVNANEKQNKVQYGDILFTTSSETPEEVGMSSVLLDEIDNLFLNSFCFGFRPYNLEKIDPYFARFYFRSYYMRDKISRLAQGSTRFNLSKLQIMKIKTKLPPLKEQQKIAQVLSTSDNEIELLKKELEALKEQKRGLMQRLLTGEVRVRV